MNHPASSPILCPTCGRSYLLVIESAAERKHETLQCDRCGCVIVGYAGRAKVSLVDPAAAKPYKPREAPC